MSWKATAYVKPITHDSKGRRLVSSEKLLLLILADYHNEERGYAWVSVSRMATEALLSERQCIRVLASLEARKLITAERRQGATCLYRFCGVRSEKLCWYCGCELYEDNKTQDHQVPVSRGGRGGKNLVLACRSCNGQKHGRTVEEYRTECFPQGHKFFGETNDKLSYVENVEPLTLTREGVTNKPKKQASMSPELLGTESRSRNLRRHKAPPSSPTCGKVENQTPQKKRFAEVGRLAAAAMEIRQAHPEFSDGDLVEALKTWAARHDIPYFDAWPGAATPIEQAITIANERIQQGHPTGGTR